MNRELIRRLGEGIFDPTVIEALCDPYYEKARGYRSAINRIIPKDQIIQFLIKYWNEKSEPYCGYRRLSKTVIHDDLPLRFRELLPSLGLRRTAYHYTSEPVNSFGKQISISVYDLRQVQGMKNIWITWHHAYLLHLRRMGTITLDQMLSMWSKSQVEIEKFIAPFYSDLKAHRMRCTLNRWANAGYLERKRRGVYQIR